METPSKKQQVMVDKQKEAAYIVLSINIISQLARCL